MRDYVNECSVKPSQGTDFRAEGEKNQRQNISRVEVSHHFKFSLKSVELISEHLFPIIA